MKEKLTQLLQEGQEKIRAARSEGERAYCPRRKLGMAWSRSCPAWI